MPKIIESGNGTLMPLTNNIAVSRRKFLGYFRYFELCTDIGIPGGKILFHG